MNFLIKITGLIAFFLIPFLSGFAQEKEQYVILISLDGFRHDYVERFQPENLLRFIENGTAAEALIPSFPTKTFPNHYTIATGMKPENHGLVDNSFYEPEKDLVYSMGNRDIVEDGYWYGGTPIWVLAEQHGIKAASYFFVGSEAPVQGIHPSYYFNFDGSVPNLTRVSKVFEWLQLPEDERPRMITLYFSDMDNIGHRYGPDNNEQIGGRLEKLDRELGALFEGLKSFELDINIFIVSDHGMTNIPKENLLNLDHITEGIQARVVNNGALAHLHLENIEEMEEVYQELKKSENHFKVVKVADREYYKNIEKYKNRFGDLIIIPDLGHYLTTSNGMVSYQNRSAMFKTDVFGEHGFSQEYKDMHGIFFANGPMVKEGMTILPFENIHVFPLLANILGLPIPDDIDGKLEILEPILKEK
ncbi:Predicted pyrophosphatase or phosphodiesterase, AlkP superfamily [Aquiflexum balticum DSM 16537]|uniref:Predicted pyrophosphatase or phosphodiesterase, AlkP superfamily n=1 Tax=Aquiflexum balticum DSM 16537 TaxID=758820 RepID=A0A1W2H4U8_9BACT|nr:ectonucleotide pyrophosphatase/phosphodiesterase [Aquiflexum balticum]SMD43648.1 Predicted pyrophosphatase or phosphodiesterase, AlkP superfamily [Aquiflexum balticum DSM 16537]